MIGEVHELGDGECVELEGVAVSCADGSEEIAIVAKRKLRVEAAVEGSQISAEGEQLVQLCEDVFVAEHITAACVRKLIKGAVIALSNADVRVIDNAHYHVGAGIRGMKAAADCVGQRTKFGVGGILPEPASVGSIDPDALVDLCSDICELARRYSYAIAHVSIVLP